ncbi:DUF3106 domain-containing protein [Rhodoferax sp.]|uniref:DUF3106 domain-containing protein n=1 Tax=Rhodoferax sp. TaxID=50421 RepID=UPI0025EE60EE|nr:DUF3106 domain-containing protein [Rhodoferax sp.]
MSASCVGVVLSLGVLPTAWAEIAPDFGPASIPLASASKPEQKPLWKELTPAQQQALKPLATHWNNISEQQKRKWLALSVNFEKMSPTMQTVLQERMLDWGALSGTQRSQARLNFAEAKRLSPAEKQAKWEAYQTLDPEEKAKLVKQVQKKLAGAATGVKLTPSQKLANVPPPRINEPKGPSIATGAHQIDPHTLLPLPAYRFSSGSSVVPQPAKPAGQ